MIPWVAVAIIFFTLIILVFMVFGGTEGDIREYMKDSTTVGWIIIGVFIIILLAGVGKVAGQTFTDLAFDERSAVNATSGSGAGDSFEGNIAAIVFNPKIIGFAVIFTIAIFAVLLLSG